MKHQNTSKNIPLNQNFNHGENTPKSLFYTVGKVYMLYLMKREFLDSTSRQVINGPILKGSSDRSLFLFEINVGKKRIRQPTILKLKDEFLDRHKID